MSAQQINVNDLNFLKTFLNRTDAYAIQKKNGQGYCCVKEQLFDTQLIEHLNGIITVGVYQLNKDNTLLWGVLDFDLGTLEDYQQAVKAYELLKQQNFSCILEKSGGNEYRAHVWLFSPKPILAIKMQTFLNKFCIDNKITPHEIFPKQIELTTSKQYGNLVKLPLGINRKSGMRSTIEEVNLL